MPIAFVVFVAFALGTGMFVGAMPLGDFFERFYRPRRLLGGSAQTVRLYYQLFRHLERHLERTPTVADLNEDCVSSFLSSFATGTWGKVPPKPRHPRTVNKSRDQLLALARYAQAKGLIAEVPDIAPMREPRTVPEAYTQDELDRLFKAIDETPGRIESWPARWYWSALAYVMLDTSGRSGAVFQLELSDVSFARGTITLRAETQKELDERVFPLHSLTIRALRSIWRPERRLLFQWSLSPASRWNHWRRIVERAGLPVGRKCAFHKLRRTVATMVHRAGGDATAQLGHASNEVTRRYYLAETGPTASTLIYHPSVVPHDEQRRLF